MRRRGADSKESEHALACYLSIRDLANNAAKVVTALEAGMSTRSQEWANERAASKSAASRHWISATAGKITELRQRELRSWEFVGLMIDGVALRASGMVVVVLGITREGDKMVLDFEPGASEKTAVAKALVERLTARGFGPLAEPRLLAVLDGSAPLSAAVQATWSLRP